MVEHSKIYIKNIKNNLQLIGWFKIGELSEKILLIKQIIRGQLETEGLF